jgi:hypothetical protein
MILAMVVAPSLLFIAVPLTFLAFLTTSLAFTTLAIRVLLIYIDLFTSILLNQLRPKKIFHSTKPQPNTNLATNHATIASRSHSLHRSRSSRSTMTASSSGSLTPKLPYGMPFTTPFYGSTATIAVVSPPVNPTRDYEGVGGWRIHNTTSDSDSDAQPWTGMNARLELPAQIISKQQQHHHQRSLTGGSLGSLTMHEKRRSGGFAGPMPGIIRNGSTGSVVRVPRSGKKSGTVSPENKSGEQSNKDTIGKRAKSMMALGKAAMGIGMSSSRQETSANVGRSRGGHSKHHPKSDNNGSRGGTPENEEVKRKSSTSSTGSSRTVQGN